MEFDSKTAPCPCPAAEMVSSGDGCTGRRGFLRTSTGKRLQAPLWWKPSCPHARISSLHHTAETAIQIADYPASNPICCSAGASGLNLLQKQVDMLYNSLPRPGEASRKVCYGQKVGSEGEEGADPGEASPGVLGPSSWQRLLLPAGMSPEYFLRSLLLIILATFSANASNWL
ncbi:hypothetical protein llap_12079 [Limosa lapponica baueri]|uniref:Uncharacterized protein n=1 Tax=Limosa lapponica baueri TaxID=1758121 RepID=A0A2I0TUY8_LIMLA|nr:hypothetical protein llap_12079 [Limosa lapponica baueri]